MHFEYTIDPQMGFIEEKFQGEIVFAGMIEALERLFSDPLYDKRYNGIVALGDATFAMDYEDMKTFAAFESESRPSLPFSS